MLSVTNSHHFYPPQNSTEHFHGVPLHKQGTHSQKIRRVENTQRHKCLNATSIPHPESLKCKLCKVRDLLSKTEIKITWEIYVQLGGGRCAFRFGGGLNFEENTTPHWRLQNMQIYTELWSSSAHPKAPVKQYASRPNMKKYNFLTRMRTGPTTPTQNDSTALHSQSTCSCHSSCRHLIWCCQGSQGLLFENLQFSFLSRAMCVIATRQVMCCWGLEVLVRPIRLSAEILLLPHYTT